MIYTIPVDNIGEETVNYVLLALLSQKTRSKLTELLSNLNTELPNMLWLMPAEQMHITLCEIIQPKNYSVDKDVLYASRKDEYEDAIGNILSSISSFNVTFDILEASTKAIITRCSNTNTFNSIRSQLMKNIQFPSETKLPPDITHSSIARYLKKIDLELVQNGLQNHTLSLDEEVTEFKLLRNTVYPLQNYEIIKSYSLL